MYKVQAPYHTSAAPDTLDTRHQLAAELKQRVKQQRMTLFENSIYPVSPMNRSNQGSQSLLKLGLQVPDATPYNIITNQ